MPDFTPYPLKFQPILHERIWGGNYLAKLFGVADTSPIGEAWTLSDHPSSPSVCQNGPLVGLTLREIIQLHPDAYLGGSVPRQFPLLIKFIDAAADLSVQVHPDDQLALQLENQSGKTESWYVLDTHAAGEIVLGHCFLGPIAVTEAAKAGTIGEYIQRRRVKAGDMLHIPSGTVHALLAGTRVIEVQQTSDVTYRLYDWNRLGTDGQPRELHVAKAAQAINYGLHDESSSSADIISDTAGCRHKRLVGCPHYTIEHIELTAQHTFTLAGPNPHVLVVAAGRGAFSHGTNRHTLAPGDTYLLPRTAESITLHPEGSLQILLASFD